MVQDSIQQFNTWFKAESSKLGLELKFRFRIFQMSQTWHGQIFVRNLPPGVEGQQLKHLFEEAWTVDCTASSVPNGSSIPAELHRLDRLPTSRCPTHGEFWKHVHLFGVKAAWKFRSSIFSNFLHMYQCIHPEILWKVDNGPLPTATIGYVQQAKPAAVRAATTWIYPICPFIWGVLKMRDRHIIQHESFLIGKAMVLRYSKSHPLNKYNWEFICSWFPFRNLGEMHPFFSPCFYIVPTTYCWIDRASALMLLNSSMAGICWDMSSRPKHPHCEIGLL